MKVAEASTHGTRRSLLDRARSRPVLAAFVIAMAARLLAASVIALVWGGSLFFDDKTFHQLASQLADGETGGWDRQTRALFRQTAAYVAPMAALYRVTGGPVFVGQLFTALLGAATAALAARAALSVAKPAVALAAGVGVALLPSQILWSSLTLKDAAVWATLVALAVVVTVINRGAGTRAVAWAVAAGALLGVLGFLRLHTLVVAGWALFLAVLVAAERRRILAVGVIGALLLVTPWSFGGGPAGASLTTAGLASLPQRRVANAKNAETAIVDEQPGERGIKDNLVHLPRGVVVMLFEPLPWTAGDDVGEKLARLETVLWYPLLALCVPGVAVAWRRRRELAFVVLCGGGVMVLYALSEGNVGTAYRHRGEFVWAVMVLAALGGDRVVRRRAGGLNPSRER